MRSCFRLGRVVEIVCECSVGRQGSDRAALSEFARHAGRRDEMVVVHKGRKTKLPSNEAQSQMITRFSSQVVKPDQIYGISDNDEGETSM
jgi:hypothetical protein